MAPRPLRAGDLVELRAPAEILATLDDAGKTEGLPFMPEMLDFFGERFRVEVRVERACDTLKWGVRRLPETVMLDDLRCSGLGHAGCQAGCRLYWKEAWLRPASESAGSFVPDDAYGKLEQLVTRNTESQTSTPEERLFRCQATDWFDASQPVGWWNVRSFLDELTCGNVNFWQFSKIMTRIVFSEIGRRLHLIPRQQFMPHNPSAAPVVAPSPQGLEPGTLVQVRSRNEIAESLDAKGMNRGLWFDREMVPHCGKTYPVKRRVERFIDEKTGKLIQLKSDCYVLDGVVCSGDLNEGKWFCRRAIYPWWREAWLRVPGDSRSTSQADNAANTTVADSAPR
jgi:hypothetical protein